MARSCLPGIHARTAPVRSATPLRLTSGCCGGVPRCCQYNTFTSLSPSRRNCARSSAPTRGIATHYSCRPAGEAIVELARNPRYCGGTVGVLEVLHTWTQQLHYHPHVHCLVTGGGISDDGSTWQPVRHMAYFVPVKALSHLVRGKFLAWLRNKRPDLYVPDSVWAQDWVVHCTPWRAGETAVLEYLARYAFRVALANCRLLAMDAQTVAFRYTDRETGKRHQCTVSGHEFIRRFLQHVLPRRFHKLRYCGVWHSSRRALLERARAVLQLAQRSAPTTAVPAAQPAVSSGSKLRIFAGAPCEACGQGHLRHIREIRRAMIRGP